MGNKILQSLGKKKSNFEIISCPTCGRTEVNIQKIVKSLKEKIHIPKIKKPIKIAVMGCIVNGPGEMADADYGYVGAGPGRVSIYKGREARLRNIAEKEALEALIGLIKDEGDWMDP